MSLAIVVTIPKSRLADVEAEERYVAQELAAGRQMYYWWSMPRLPRRRSEVTRCYFVWGGAVRAWHAVIGWQDEPHRVRKVLLDPQIHPVDPPVPMAPFRGFRYMEVLP